MSFTPVRLRPCTQALAARTISASLGHATSTAVSSSSGSGCRGCWQLTTPADPSRRHHHGLRRATRRIGNVGRYVGSRVEENQVRSAGGTRLYTAWSPSTSEDKTSLNLPSATEGVQRQQQQQQPPPPPPPPPPLGDPKPRRKTPEAVAMEEFAALERKLAPPRRKTPEEIAMEEFAALERKLGSSSGQQRGVRKARSPPLIRPQEPDAQECCGNGCATCVWIGYWEELQAWEEAEREREEAPP